MEYDIFFWRHKTKEAIRKFFNDEGFIEVDPPYLLDANTPDPYIDPLSVINLKQKRWQLHTSPEIWLKKSMCYGLKRIYHMGRVFRDDISSPWHSPEFTMIEWYRAYAGLNDLVNDVKHILLLAYKEAKSLNLLPKEHNLEVIYTDVASLFREHVNLDLASILHDIENGHPDALPQALLNLGEYLPDQPSFYDAFAHCMTKYIEPNLPLSPVIISRWPKQMAALAAPCVDDPYFCDRFEFYFGGIEIANAYRECCDPQVLRSRFQKENCLRIKMGKSPFIVDEDFLLAIEKMPQPCGIALGFDRLLQAIAVKKSISEIIFGYHENY